MPLVPCRRHRVVNRLERNRSWNDRVVARIADGLDDPVDTGDSGIELNGCALSGEVDVRLVDAVGLAERALNAGSARSAGHARDWQVDALLAARFYMSSSHRPVRYMRSTISS